MNSLAYACAALVGTAAAASASTADRAIIAAMKLSEQPNYSWFSMFDESSGSFEIEGKTTPGATWVRMPMPPSLGRQLGREADTQLEAYFNDQRVGVVRMGSVWLLPGEVGDHREHESAERSRTMVRGSASGRFGLAGRPSVGAAAPFLTGNRGARAFSARAFGVTHPHEELAIIVSSHASLEAEGELVSGTLTDMGAALLLVRDGQTDVEPLTSTGSFRLWLKNGVVVKYHLKLEGRLLVSRWKKVNVTLNATTSLKEFGTTRVDVPIEARDKLAMAQ